MSSIDPVRLVFVDECGTHTSMTRRRARAVRAPAPGAGMSPAMTVEGGTTAAVFATYLEWVLTPARPSARACARRHRGPAAGRPPVVEAAGQPGSGALPWAAGAGGPPQRALPAHVWLSGRAR